MIPPRPTTLRTFRRLAAGIAAAVVASSATVARAQDTIPAPAPADTQRVEILISEPYDWARIGGPSPALPGDHWAVRAAARAEALGLAPGFFPAQRAVPRHVVAAALERAASDASGPLESLADGWWARFQEEFPEYTRPAERGRLVPLGVALSAGYADASGRLSPATGYQGTRVDPVPVGDESGALLGGAVGVSVRGVAALSLEGGLEAGEAELTRWEGEIGLGAFALSVGRAEVGYGYGRGGSVVLSPGAPLPRVEAQTTRPVRLPGFLRGVGEWSLHTFAGPVDEDRHPTEPWLWGARLALRPHPRFTLAVNRASIFGGEGRPATLRNLAGMVVGVIRSDFENQVVAGEARWRLPTDRVLPATAYLEWGADDGAGALDEQPARLAGVFFPAVSGIPQVALGAEYARFEGCCGHGAWYHNATFPGNWARGDRTLGHPLGGAGSEAAAYAQAELLDARLRLDGRAFARERSGDATLGGNLFAPLRAGRSRGGEVRAALRLGRAADLRAAFFRDAGDGWREQAFRADVAVFF